MPETAAGEALVEGQPTSGAPGAPVVPSAEMSFMEHLSVLRKHLVRAGLWFVLAAALSFFYVDRAWEALMIPLCEVKPDQCYVYPRDLMEAFWVYLKLAALLAFFVSSPMLFFEAWGFVAPGLYAHEKKVALPVSFAVGILFASGAAFGFFAAFPTAFRFFFGLEAANQFTYLISMQSYFRLSATLLIAFGVVFELPLVMMLFASMGLVTPRWFSRYRRIMYLVMLIFSAVVTPTTDPVTMLLMGGPMIVLYEVGILLCRLVYRPRAAPTAG